MKRAILLTAVLLLWGCTKIAYIGDEYPPTTHVDTYYAEADVEQEYRTIGHVDAKADEFVGTSKMMKDIKKKAMKVGADGIIFLGLDQYTTTGATTWSEVTKVEGDKTTVTGTQSTSTSTENKVKALFIKYK